MICRQTVQSTSWYAPHQRAALRKGWKVPLCLGKRFGPALCATRASKQFCKRWASTVTRQPPCCRPTPWNAEGLGAPPKGWICQRGANNISFRNHHIQLRLFVIYTDFEALTMKIKGPSLNPKKSNMQKKEHHKVCGFCYIVVPCNGNMQLPIEYHSTPRKGMENWNTPMPSWWHDRTSTHTDQLKPVMCIKSHWLVTPSKNIVMWPENTKVLPTMPVTWNCICTKKIPQFQWYFKTSRAMTHICWCKLSWRWKARSLAFRTTKKSTL